MGELNELEIRTTGETQKNELKIIHELRVEGNELHIRNWLIENAVCFEQKITYEALIALMSDWNKYKDALDKACEELTSMKKATDCWAYDCPFREACEEGPNYCYNKEAWKEHFLNNG